MMGRGSVSRDSGIETETETQPRDSGIETETETEIEF